MQNVVTNETIQCCFLSQSNVMEKVDLNTEEHAKPNTDEHCPAET